MKAWVGELRDTLYEASNILDLCQLKAMERCPRPDIRCFNPLLFCMRNPLHAHDMGKRIKKLNQRLEQIRNRSVDFGFINLGSYEYRNRRVASSRPSSRETSGELEESGLVGEKIQDTRNLVEIDSEEKEGTNSEQNKIKVFAIVGVGGIGKTILAQKIFNNEEIQQEFTKRMWLCLNKDFSETELLMSAIEVAGGHRTTANTKAVPEQILKEQ